MIDKRQEFERIRSALGDLAAVTHDGHAVDQLVHSCQMATWFRRARAVDDEVVFALVHDVGKVWHEEHHGRVAAAIMFGRLRPDLVETLATHSEMLGGRRPAVTPAEKRFLQAYAEIHPASYRADPLSSFLGQLETVMSR